MIDHATRVTPKELLGDPITHNYDMIQGMHWYLMHNRPTFTYQAIHDMSTDPRIQFGLGLIRGPLQAHADWEIEASSTEVEKFVREQLEWFWLISARKALASLEWGFSGSEVMYREKEGNVSFHDLRYLYAMDTRAVINKGNYVGMYLRQHGVLDNQQTHTNHIYLGGPKSFWTVHERQTHYVYGRSRLFPAHPAWWEKWSEGGYRDIRRLWYYKNSFDSGTMYFPDGDVVSPTGEQTSNLQIAQQIGEQMRTGNVKALPNRTNSDGKREWEYEPPKSNPAPSGLLEYGDRIDKELLEAIGIPPEVVESQSSEGFGSSSGREIPTIAFFASLQEIFNCVTFDFVDQILNYIVPFNFENASFRVRPMKLIEVYKRQMSPELEQKPNEPNAPKPKASPTS